MDQPSIKYVFKKLFCLLYLNSMKIGEVVVIYVYKNFTNFHWFQMTKKKVFLVTHLTDSPFFKGRWIQPITCVLLLVLSKKIMTLVNLVTCLQEADESDYPEERYMSTNNYLYNQQLSPYYRQKLLLRQQLLKQQQMRRLLNHRNQLNNGILNVLITIIIFAQGYSLLLKIAVITFSRKYWYYWRKCRANRFRTWYNWY